MVGGSAQAMAESVGSSVISLVLRTIRFNTRADGRPRRQRGTEPTPDGSRSKERERRRQRRRHERQQHQRARDAGMSIGNGGWWDGMEMEKAGWLTGGSGRRSRDWLGGQMQETEQRRCVSRRSRITSQGQDMQGWIT
ncbi:hypothetical protein CHU98_g3768 [Xylaria longipes]|nr:hypothetical protein CHU98_g3768 [Xylaria longipes]